MGQRLSDQLVRGLPAPARGNVVHYDAPGKRGNDWTPGFGLRITAAGARAFILNYRTKAGTERRYTIGRYPTWTLLAARDEAKRRKREIDGGADPVTEGRELRGAPTVAELCKQFLDEHVPTLRPSTARDYKGILNLIKHEIGNQKINSIELDDIRKLHRRITEGGAPYRANRVIAVLSKAYNEAAVWKEWKKWVPVNPCKGVKRNDEEECERPLTPKEVARLLKVLDEWADQEVANILRLDMYTGRRISEAIYAEWSEFDTSLASWTKMATNTKQKKKHAIPLSAPARALLARLAKHRAGERLFPGWTRQKVWRHWQKILGAAGISDVRLHDLRHTYGTVLGNEGMPALTIARLLGHSKLETTRRYVHLSEDALTRATETAGAILSGKKKAPVVPLRGRR